MHAELLHLRNDIQLLKKHFLGHKPIVCLFHVVFLFCSCTPGAAFTSERKTSLLSNLHYRFLLQPCFLNMLSQRPRLICSDAGLIEVRTGWAITKCTLKIDVITTRIVQCRVPQEKHCSRVKSNAITSVAVHSTVSTQGTIFFFVTRTGFWPKLVMVIAVYKLGYGPTRSNFY